MKGSAINSGHLDGIKVNGSMTVVVSRREDHVVFGAGGTEIHKTSRQGGESEVNRRHCCCRLLTCRVGRRQTLQDGSRGQPCRKPLCCSPTSSLRNLPLCAPAFEGEVVWSSVLARLCNLRQFPPCGLYLSMQLAKDAEKVASMS